MRFGSICSGIEAASQAWEPLGWKPVFFAEVDPFPATVLHYRQNATRPLRPLVPAEAENEKDRKQRESWGKQLAAIPAGGRISNLGDFTKITTEDYVGDIDLLVGGTPCFPAGALVLTEHGYRDIAELQVGDKVVSHTGKLRRILRIGSKMANNVGTCKIIGRPEFEVTSNHPLLSCEGKRDYQRKSSGYGRLAMHSLQWQSVGESVGKFAARLNIRAELPKIKPPTFPAVYTANRKQILNLIGWYLCDGYIRRHTGKNKKCVIYCLSDAKLAHFRELFESAVHYSVSASAPGMWKVQVANTALAEFVAEWFGKLSGSKYLPAWS